MYKPVLFVGPDQSISRDEVDWVALANNTGCPSELNRFLSIRPGRLLQQAQEECERGMPHSSLVFVLVASLVAQCTF